MKTNAKVVNRLQRRQERQQVVGKEFPNSWHCPSWLHKEVCVNRRMFMSVLSLPGHNFA